MVVRYVGTGLRARSLDKHFHRKSRGSREKEPVLRCCIRYTVWLCAATRIVTMAEVVLTDMGFNYPLLVRLFIVLRFRRNLNAVTMLALNVYVRNGSNPPLKVTR